MFRQRISQLQKIVTYVPNKWITYVLTHSLKIVLLVLVLSICGFILSMLLLYKCYLNLSLLFFFSFFFLPWVLPSSVLVVLKIWALLVLVLNNIYRIQKLFTPQIFITYQEKKKKFWSSCLIFIFWVYWIAGYFGGNNPSPNSHRRCSP